MKTKYSKLLKKVEKLINKHHELVSAKKEDIQEIEKVRKKCRNLVGVAPGDANNEILILIKMIIKVIEYES